MGDDVQVGSATFKVQATGLDTFVPGMAEAQGAVDKLGGSMEIAQGVMEGLLGAEAIEKVGEFVSEGVKEFVEFDRSIQTMVQNMDRMGLGFTGLKEQINDYASASALATRFNKTETLDSLNQLVTRTKDLSQATYINNLAMDLAVAKNKSLSETSHELAFAMTGDTRGVMMLSRELGIARDAGMDAEQLFKVLEDRFSGAAKAEDTLSEKTASLTHDMRLLGEQLLEKGNFALGLEMITQLGHGVVQELGEILGIRKEDAQAQLKSLEFQAAALQAQIQHRESMGLTNDKRKEELALLKQKIAYLHETTDVEVKKEEEKEAAQKKAFHAKLEMDKERRADEAQAAQDEADMAKADEKYKKIADLEAEAYGRKRIDQFKVQEDHWREVIKLEKEFGNIAATTVTKDMTTFFDNVKKGTADIRDGFQAVGRDMAKGVLLGLAKVEEQYAAQDFVEAATFALSYDFADAAISAGKGGLWASAAGATTSIANGMAKGGYTVGGNPSTDTIPAMLKQNEIVVPLDDPKAKQAIGEAMGGGGITIEQMNFHGADGRPETARSHAFMFLDQLAEARQRTGLRGSRQGAF